MTERRLEPHELAEAGPAEAVRLPLSSVDPSPSNPRQALVEVEALADSIREFGLLQPVSVRRQGDRYELLGGHRRLAAVKLLMEAEPHDVQWRSIPAVVRTMDDDDQAYLALLAQAIHSKAWRPREEAAALERLAVEHTLKQIGAMVHKGESWVGKRLRIYSDSTLSAYVQSGRLSAAVAAELLIVADPAVKRELAERAAAEGWSMDQARAAVRALKVSRQLRELDRQIVMMLDVLATVEGSQLPLSTTRNLWTLHGRIEVLARGGPIIPTIAEAERAAGVNPNAQPRKPKGRRRTMPPPS